MAPSQPRAPPTPPVPPVYPFQCICADYFHYKGNNYLVIVDRYTNWPIVERASDGATGLVNCLRRHFSTYGIAEELASDGGPEFTATSTQKFLQNWGVHHRLSSVAFPHSNCRAEIGVKTVKRMITGNSGPQGELDTDKFQRAILQYRNCPDRDTKMSPAECLFGHPIRDFIPILPGRYKPHNTWRETMQAREEALRNRHMKAAERWSEHTRRLPPLAVGHRVRIQNQVGRYPNKWDRTGTVVEVRQYDQYVVKVDGSGRITTRNRKFLRKFIPAMPSAPTIPINRDLSYQKPADLRDLRHQTREGVELHLKAPQVTKFRRQDGAPATAPGNQGSPLMRSPNDDKPAATEPTGTIDDPPLPDKADDPPLSPPLVCEPGMAYTPTKIGMSDRGGTGCPPTPSSSTNTPVRQRPTRVRSTPKWHGDYDMASMAASHIMHECQSLVVHYRKDLGGDRE
jgi:hypothetical protein